MDENYSSSLKIHQAFPHFICIYKVFSSLIGIYICICTDIFKFGHFFAQCFGVNYSRQSPYIDKNSVVIFLAVGFLFKLRNKAQNVMQTRIWENKINIIWELYKFLAQAWFTLIFSLYKNIVYKLWWEWDSNLKPSILWS